MSESKTGPTVNTPATPSAALNPAEQPPLSPAARAAVAGAQASTARAQAAAAAPADNPVIMQLRDAIIGPEEVTKRAQREAFRDQLNAEDAAREKAPKITLKATTGFTMFGDDLPPEGKVIKAGEDFEISMHDLHRYSGRGLPSSPDPMTGGVTVQQG